MIASMALVLVAYGLGSVPFSFLVARLFGVADVRRVGSGNVGATNVLRTAGPSAGILAFLLDAAKGATRRPGRRSHRGRGLGRPQLRRWPPFSATCYPVWLRFEGGKGVATGFGAFLPTRPPGRRLAQSCAFGVVAAVESSRVARFHRRRGHAVRGRSGPWRRRSPVIAGAAIVAALVLLRHRSNILRIVRGALGRAEGKGGA